MLAKEHSSALQDGSKTGRISDLPFSSEHKARFQELRAIGELYAVNGHSENLDFGPWLVSCNLTDSDTAFRLNARFRAAAQKAAMAAAAPCRVNRLNWWIGKLTHGKPLGFIQDLIQRSAEYCEELETRGIELGRAPTKPDVVGGLYRDRYPCDWGEPYALYDGPPRSVSDPKVEFEYWSEHIWSGFSVLVAKLDQMHSARKRQDKETRKEFRDRMRQRVHDLYASMRVAIRGLSYDLAVLQANYIIDRGLRGDAAISTFQDDSASLIESVRTFGRNSSKRLGLSYGKQEKEGVDPAKPFREVREDLRNLTSAIPSEAPSGISEQAARRQISAPENASRPVLKTGKRRGRRPNQERRDAIRTVIRAHGGQWRDHLNDIFTELDSQEVALGDFQTLKMDLGEGQSAPVSTWAALDLAVGEQRRQIIDTLRKYTD
jgi:hypothetical protein